MTYPFSSRVNIPSSATVTINSMAQQKKAAGERVFNLSAGEPIVNTSRYFADTVNSHLTSGMVPYPPVAGLDELRELASDWINKNYKSSFTAKNTLISCGGKFGIYLFLQAFLNQDDEVLVMAPYWVSYPSMIKLFGGKPIIVATDADHDWKVKAEDLRNSCTDKTKILIINNAANPTGVLYSREELEEILAVAKEKNLLVLSDEVYSILVYDEQEYHSCASFPEYADRVIVAHSCSKSFGMTGWRVGLTFAPEEVAQMLIKLQGQSITGTSVISQWAAISAMKQSDVITREIRDEMEKRRNFFIENFNRLFKSNLKAPQSAFYGFIPLSAFGKTKFSELQNNDVAFCENLLGSGNVATVPGSAFGQPGYVRTSFGAEIPELQASLEAMHRFLLD